MKLPFLFLDTQQFQAPSRGEGGREEGSSERRRRKRGSSCCTHGSLGNRYFGYLRNVLQPRHFCCSARSVYPSTQFIRTEAGNKQRQAYSTAQLGASVVQ